MMFGCGRNAAMHLIVRVFVVVVILKNVGMRAPSGFMLFHYHS